MVQDVKRPSGSVFNRNPVFGMGAFPKNIRPEGGDVWLSNLSGEGGLKIFASHPPEDNFGTGIQ